MDNDILLLIAAYLRKQNYPSETDQQIQAGVVADLLKVRAAKRQVDIDLLDAPPQAVPAIKKAKGLV